MTAHVWKPVPSSHHVTLQPTEELTPHSTDREHTRFADSLSVNPRTETSDGTKFFNDATYFRWSESKTIDPECNTNFVSSPSVDVCNNAYRHPWSHIRNSELVTEGPPVKDDGIQTPTRQVDESVLSYDYRYYESDSRLSDSPSNHATLLALEQEDQYGTLLSSEQNVNHQDKTSTSGLPDSPPILNMPTEPGTDYFYWYPQSTNELHSPYPEPRNGYHQPETQTREVTHNQSVEHIPYNSNSPQERETNVSNYNYEPRIEYTNLPSGYSSYTTEYFKDIETYSRPVEEYFSPEPQPAYYNWFSDSTLKEASCLGPDPHVQKPTNRELDTSTIAPQENPVGPEDPKETAVTTVFIAVVY
ncbi:unnamed protein product [Meganyctiphanes norvegica]|uniref:Uncharacterized protein n=1 Tax=Meganyctiphanes norvegica TaxID=48144 RepID=A0AAV2PGP3_MEGNR